MSKVKVQITLEDTLLNSLDLYCEKNYINRSAALSFMASQFLMQHHSNMKRRIFNEKIKGIQN